jgi:hypothetical protein
MRRLSFPLLAIAALMCGCSSNDSTGSGGSLQPIEANLTEVPGMSNYALAEPIQVNNVSIVPVVSKEKQEIGPEYATLAEAKKNAWIEIIEEPGDAEVNQLKVHNVGPKPILLLSGELLLGGKQDRVVAKDTIVPPGKEIPVPVYCVEPGRWTDTIVPPGKEIPVPVYCVEPGRWTGSSEHFSYGDTTVPLKVRNQAVFGDQAGVWREVGGYNADVAAPSGRSTVENGLEQEKVQKQISVNLDEVRSKLEKNKNVVGMMFLIDGEVQTLELFGNNRLFSASRDSLLKGALAQAAAGEGEAGKKVDLGSCAKFMADAMQSNRVVEKKENGTVAARRASPSSKGVELHFDDGVAGAKSGLVHGSYAKQ